MIGFLAWLLKNGVGVALGIFLLPLTARWAFTHIQNASWPAPEWWAILAGAALAIIMHLWRRPTYFLHTYLHENAHAFMCILLRVPVKGFTATDGQGGAVEHVRADPIRSVLILIAPYIAPFYLAPALVIRQLVPVAWPEAGQGLWLMLLQFVVGLALCWQIWDISRNLRYNFIGKDSDLQRVGQLLGLVLIALVWICIAVWFVLAVTAPATTSVL